MKTIIKSPITSIKVYDVTSRNHSLIEVKGRPFWALTYRKRGITKINIDGKTIISKENCITLTPKGKTYTTEVLADTDIIAIHFECLDDSAFQTPFVIENSNRLISNFFELLLKKHSAEDAYNSECFAIFYELLSEVEKYLRCREEKKQNQKILKAKNEIDNNFSDNNFNINKLSDSLGVNTSYLRREFRKAFSTSPISYLKEVRLQNAVSLLVSDYYSIDEIAKKCGYGSASYFIQVFHKKKGCSPQKYKERHLSK